MATSSPHMVEKLADHQERSGAEFAPSLSGPHSVRPVSSGLPLMEQEKPDNTILLSIPSVLFVCNSELIYFNSLKLCFLIWKMVILFNYGIPRRLKSGVCIKHEI